VKNERGSEAVREKAGGDEEEQVHVEL